MFFFWKNQNIDLYEKRISQLIPKINFLYENKNLKGIKSCLKNTALPLLVDSLERINNLDKIFLFLVAAQKLKLGQLFLSFNQENRIKILEKIHSLVLVDLLNDLNADDVVQLLQEVPKNLHKKIILNSSTQLRNEIKKIKDFENTQVGSIMNTTIFTLQEKMIISEAISYIRKMKNEFDIEQEIYVVDEEKKIVGKIKVQDLLFSETQTELLSEVIDKSFVLAYASDDVENIIDLFKKYNLNTVAIVNERSEILGIINGNDIIPEIVEGSIEDVYKFYGIRETGESYLRSSVLDIVKSRIFWLLIMLFAATFTTLAIDKFENLGVHWTAGISSAILVPIIPIITDMCGNTGSQTTATVIQGIASGEIKEEHFSKVLAKELKVSIVIGAILCIFNFLRLVIYFSLIPLSDDKFHINATASGLLKLVSSALIFLNTTATKTTAKAELSKTNLFKISLVGAGASSLSLFLVVVLSKFFGVFIPFLAIRLKYDPASFSTPVLTTILDTLSSVIFFFIGTFLIYYSICPILNLTVNDGKLLKSTKYSEMGTYKLLENHFSRVIFNFVG